MISRLAAAYDTHRDAPSEARICQALTSQHS